MFEDRHGDALAGLDRGAFRPAQAFPLRAPGAFGGGAVGLGQAVDLGDVEAHRFDLGERRWGGGRAGGEDLDGLIEAAALVGRRVDQHVEHDGGAAEMGHALVGDGVEDGRGGDVAAADQPAADHRHHPGVAPAVAVEQRHDGEIAGPQHHAPADHLAHRVQVGAAVVIDDALGPARGAGGVVERDAFPFVLRHDPVEGGVGGGEHVLVGRVACGGGVAAVGVGHLDQERFGGIHLSDGGLGEGDELGISQDNLRAAVGEDIGDGVGFEPRVDRVEDRAAGGHAEMRLGLGGQVGDEGGHHVARPHAFRGKRGREAGHAVGIFRVGLAVRAIDDGKFVRIDARGAAQGRERGQRDVICGRTLQPRLICHPAHRTLSQNLPMS